MLPKEVCWEKLLEKTHFVRKVALLFSSVFMRNSVRAPRRAVKWLLLERAFENRIAGCFLLH